MYSTSSLLVHRTDMVILMFHSFWFPRWWSIFISAILGDCVWDLYGAERMTACLRMSPNYLPYLLYICHPPRATPSPPDLLCPESHSCCGSCLVSLPVCCHAFLFSLRFLDHCLPGSPSTLPAPRL